MTPEWYKQKTISLTPTKDKKYQALLERIGVTYQQHRAKAYTAVNQEKVLAYWAIGQHIVEYEQEGKIKAEYGKGLLVQLAKDLRPVHGKGFSRSNLYLMRQVYIKYPKIQTLSGKLN